MTLIELSSDEAVKEFIQTNSKALLTFSATWCGPCKASKPALEQMAMEYSNDITKGVKFGIVYEHNLGDQIHNYSVRAFPTYALFVSQSEFGRVEGANLQGIRELIDRSGPSLDLSKGQSLGGGDSTPLSKEEARAQRLAKLGASTASQPPAEMEAEKQTETANNTVEETKDVEMKDVEMKDAEATDSADAAKADRTAGLDPEAIKTLTESMGFPLLRAQKGLLFGNTPTVEGAVEWLMQHQDDDDIDDPIPDEPVGTAQSYKCNECGKILSNMANLELHANKTGHSDFEESTASAPTLTPEEKAKKIAEIKELLKAKRAEREEAEKVDNVDREKQRRFMGKEMAKTREQMEMEQRKREALKRKKEKEDFKRERERLRAELAKDKAERMSNKGKLSSKLGVEGYKPDGVQYELDDDGQPMVEVKKAKAQASTAKIDEYIKKVSSYRAGGDGGKCLKVLNTIVGNLVDQPDEEKFKTIKLDTKVFKNKIKPFVGAKQLLLAVGFNPSDDGTALVLKDDANMQVLADTRTKLQAAFDAY